MRPILACLLALLLTPLAGCLPSRFVIDLDPGEGRLRESTVVEGSGTSAKIALIDVRGLISHSPPPGLIASGANSVDALVKRLDKARKDPKVRAVVLRINSPGGTVAASETMFNEIARFRAETGRPVVVSMSEITASGGYYISLAGDYLFAQPSTITGSVGVIFQTFNVSRGLAKIGVSARSVTSGPNKALASPLEPEHEEHYRIIQAMVDDFYASFRDHVRDRRPAIAAGDMDTATDGRVFTGSQALAIGLVDELGGLHEALDKARALADAPGARLVSYHTPGRTPGSAYAQTPSTAPGAVRFDMSLSLDAASGATGFYYLWSPPGG